MKEKLIAYFEHKLRQMDINPTVRNVYFDQAFGALDFAMRLTDDWDAESELIDVWNNEWKIKFENKIYGEN